MMAADERPPSQWHVGESLPGPAVGTRVLIVSGLAVFWFLAFIVATINIMGDCFGTEDECSASASAALARFATMGLLVLVTTVVALIAAVIDRPRGHVLLALVSGLTIALAVIDLTDPGRVGPVPGGLILAAPGPVILCIAAALAYRRTRLEQARRRSIRTAPFP